MRGSGTIVVCVFALFGCGTTSAPNGAPIDDTGSTATDTGVDDADGTSTCVADLSSDPANCGACGHDCLGGACSAGTCQAFELVRPPVRAFVIDETNAYVLTDDKGLAIVRAVGKSDGASSVVMSSAGCLQAMTAAHGFFYASVGACGARGERLQKIGADGGVAWDVAAPRQVYRIAVGGADVGESLFCGSDFTGTVTSYSLDRGAASPPPAYNGQFMFAVDADALYLVRDGNFVRQLLSSGMGTVLGPIQPDGPPPDAGAPLPAVLEDVAFGGALYWLEPTGATTSTLYAMDVITTTRTELAAIPSYASSVATDGANVYVATVGAVLRVPVAGGAPSTIATSPPGVRTHVAVDDLAVYWSWDAGSLMKLAK